MSNIRPDIVNALRIPELQLSTASILLDYWPTRWGGYAPLSVAQYAWTVYAFGFTLFGTRKADFGNTVGFCRAGSKRAWFLTTYEPAHLFNFRRIGNRYLWRTGK